MKTRLETQKIRNTETANKVDVRRWQVSRSTSHERRIGCFCYGRSQLTRNWEICFIPRRIPADNPSSLLWYGLAFSTCESMTTQKCVNSRVYKSHDVVFILNRSLARGRFASTDGVLTETCINDFPGSKQLSISFGGIVRQSAYMGFRSCL